MDYGMPHAHTLPSFKAEIVEVLSPTNPLGIKAGGEGGTTPALAVIVSAIVDALRDYGIRDIADAGDAVHDLAGDPAGEGEIDESAATSLPSPLDGQRERVPQRTACAESEFALTPHGCRDPHQPTNPDPPRDHARGARRAAAGVHGLARHHDPGERVADHRPRVRRRAQPALAGHRLSDRQHLDHRAVRQDQRHPRPPRHAADRDLALHAGLAGLRARAQHVRADPRPRAARASAAAD